MILSDISQNIEDQVSELENNILTGLILVAVVLLFFMGGLRNALFVAIAIPLSMLISFLVLKGLDITLNVVVLFSLVLALGMLVDNAIVIVENIYRHASMGKSLVQGAMDGVAEVAWPVIASTATTVGAFFPMLFWPGIMGEFMYYLPLTVVIVLLASLFVALVINPVICALFMKVRRPKAAANESEEEASARMRAAAQDELKGLPSNFVYRIYEASLRFAVTHRTLVALGVVASFILTFMVFTNANTGVEFFPETTPDRIFVNVTLPDGSNLDASDRVVRRVERNVSGDQSLIKAWVSDVGAGNGNQMDFGSGGSAQHRSRMTIEFVGRDDQEGDPLELIKNLRAAVSDVVGAEVEVVKQEDGPPTGPPINIEIVGDNYDILGEKAQEVSRAIRDIEGLVNLKDNFETGRSEITVQVKREEAADLGLSTGIIASTVRTAINGTKASVFRENDEEYDIIVRLQKEDREDVQAIRRLKIKSKDGDYIDLQDVAAVVTQPSYGSIRHVDSERVVTVSAEAAEGANADALLKEVQKKLAADVAMPSGYQLRYTGQNKDQKEAQEFLSGALMAALFAITLILVTQFNSILQPMIIIASVILSLLGVLWILILRQLPFSIIMTGVGIISLAGVVVNNAIVLIDYANQLKARGFSSNEAVVRAGMVRFRPVLLTAFTTLLSLLPIVLGFSLDVKNFKIVFGGRSVEMWGPMANAVTAGLAVATALTLIVVPVMYATIDSFKDMFTREGRAAIRDRRRAEREAKRQARADKKTPPKDVTTSGEIASPAREVESV